MFTAYYLPALPTDREDPTRDGFNSREEAEAYIDTQVCEDCYKGHREPDGYDACYCEWIVAPTDELDAADSLEDVFKAAGFKRVYPEN